jgi:hypothetical protein
MADARPDKATLPSSSKDRSAGANANKSKSAQMPPAGDAATVSSRLAAAATIDELLAKEAIANLKRARATVRTAPVKSTARVIVPPATIVVRPPKSHAWMTPFISLAVVVGLSTLMCAGGLAYLSLRPMAITKTSDAELRSLRESVALLRRNVAELSSQVASNRTAADATNKATGERLGQFVQSLDQAGRQPAPLAANAVRTVGDKGSMPRYATAEPASEVTGTIQQPAKPARREIIAEWQVRRAYDGVAVLEGKSGVIEVMPGQDVPTIGRIQEIKYENGSWQVLTSKGVIISAR